MERRKQPLEYVGEAEIGITVGNERLVNLLAERLLYLHVLDRLIKFNPHLIDEIRGNLEAGLNLVYRPDDDTGNGVRSIALGYGVGEDRLPVMRESMANWVGGVFCGLSDNKKFLDLK